MSQAPDLDLDLARVADLPPTVRDLVRLVGPAKAMDLVTALGGTTFPVAQGRTRQGQIRYEMLAEIVGYTAADRITQHYSGESLYIPRCEGALRQARDRAIHDQFDRLLAQGWTATRAVGELARLHRLSDRRVWSILKQLPAHPPAEQGQLF